MGSYSGHQRRVFLAAFNAAHLAGHDEGSCFAIAHAAAKVARVQKGKR